MLSEEEKKAIQILKDWLCKTHSEFCKVGAIGIPDKEFFATETVLNLIDKQQKEIEKNKKIFIQYEKRVNELEREIAINSISKDKIREKIENLENYIQENSDEQGYWGSKHQEDIYAKIEILEELLGE